MLFLSYAAEDMSIAVEIAEWFVSRGIKVYHWRDPQRRGGRFIRQIEGAIRNADAFLAVLSPSFLTSDWCLRERDLALQREQHLRTSHPDRVFIHVLQVRNTPISETGFLGGYDWADLTNSAEWEAELGELATRIEPYAAPGSATSEAISSLSFRNRDDELEKVLRGLTTTGGPCFWLVVAPPQLGKSWFLQRISDDAALSASAGWVTRLVDVRTQPDDVRSDAAALLACLFGLTSPVAIEEDTFFSIAQEISRSGKPHLCLLDSAELLDRQTAVTLRSCLSQICRFVQDARRNSVRLALVVASRREDEWRGVTPAPRLCPLPLTEFNVDVVQQALQDLAQEMDRDFSSAEFRSHAALVLRLTEGLPALLVRCLQWIQVEEWLRMGRLDSQQLFDRLADDYIREGLLARDSLLPQGQGRQDRPLDALEHSYRVLAPYRLFTQSHLRHHLDSDPSFRAALEDQGWSIEDLWRAIGGTALLTRPLNEPWQQIPAAIRRLLYRCYYKTDEHRADAHCDARKFVETWADQQVGKEQVIGLVECLWHEATALSRRQPAEIQQGLRESARTLSLALRESPAYTAAELRDYAAERMRDDDELRESISNIDGLFERLIEIVVSPPQEP